MKKKVKKIQLSGSKKAIKNTIKGSLKKPRVSGIKKQYLKSRSVCRVTFMLPNAAALDSQQVALVGDFNNWSVKATPMKRIKNGGYSVNLDLEPGRGYRFRYFIDGCRWENDWNADRYEQNPYGGDDSIVVV
jgi:1,4-alpha-glucan branching enzyme